MGCIYCLTMRGLSNDKGTKINNQWVIQIYNLLNSITTRMHSSSMRTFSGQTTTPTPWTVTPGQTPTPPSQVHAVIHTLCGQTYMGKNITFRKFISEGKKIDLADGSTITISYWLPCYKIADIFKPGLVELEVACHNFLQLRDKFSLFN